MGIRRANYRPVYQMPAYAMATPETNGAPLSRVNDIPVRVFDDTTPEYIQGSFWLPSNYDPTKDITIQAAVASASPAEADVAFELQTLALADGDSTDGTWTSSTVVIEDAIDNGVAMDHLMDVCEMTFSRSWTAGDLVFFKFGRKANDIGDNLTGDLRLYHLTIEVPVT